MFGGGLFPASITFAVCQPSASVGREAVKEGGRERGIGIAAEEEAR